MTRSQSEKFFFDMNVFDEDGMELRELEANKPPPTFSGQKVEEARQEGFARGKQEGLQESAASRDQLITKLLDKISQDASTLFTAESEREKMYEQESTKLAFAMLQRLFPVYSEKHGFDELKGALTNLLQKAQGQAEIVIEVQPDAVSEIENHIKKAPSTARNETKFKVLGNETLGTGDCLLSWSNGGALRNSLALANKITDLMEEALAAGGGSVHDSIEDQESPPSESVGENVGETTEESAEENVAPESSEPETVEIKEAEPEEVKPETSEPDNAGQGEKDEEPNGSPDISEEPPKEY